MWRATLAGFCATLVGNGLGRFAFTPLIPALIESGWFPAAATFYLQAANLGGYVLGAIFGRPLAHLIGNTAALRSMMVLATVALFACAWPLSFWWFAIWRFASGLSGGILIVLAADAVLPHVPLRKAGLAGGIIFAGVAVGIAGSGAVVPVLLRLGLVNTWLGLGAISSALTVSAWGGWPQDKKPPTPVQRPEAVGNSHRSDLLLASLYVEYALVAVALVPHMVFIVDFVARGLGHGLTAGSLYWVAFGLSAIIGSLLSGWLGDRIGFRPALRLVLAIEIAAVLMPALLQASAPLVLSTILVGAFVPGSSTLVLGCIQEIARNTGNVHKAAWSIATVSFALGQATAAYFFTGLFALTGSYALLFASAASALALALALDLIVNQRRPAA